MSFEDIVFLFFCNLSSILPILNYKFYYRKVNEAYEDYIKILK